MTQKTRDRIEEQTTAAAEEPTPKDDTQGAVEEGEEPTKGGAGDVRREELTAGSGI